MANPKKDGLKNENTNRATPFKPKRRRKKKWPIMMLFILILASIGYYFRKPILHQIRAFPIISQFLSESPQEETLSVEALSAKVTQQEQEIQKLKAEKEALEANHATLKEENTYLKQYEEMYNDFLSQKETWDEEVAKTNPGLFIEQFEHVYPDTAERLYTLLKGQKNLSDKQKTLSKTIEQMDETQAAQAIELLITTDTELLRIIFEGMSIDRKALILSEMSSQSAAQIIKLIAPENQVMD